MTELKPIITYSRSGGFAGLLNKLDLYKDGTIVKMLGRKVERTKVPDSKLAEIIELFDKKNFFGMSSDYTKELAGCADTMEYRLSYDYKGRKHEVSARDLGNPPKEFFELTKLLEKL